MNRIEPSLIVFPSNRWGTVCVKVHIKDPMLMDTVTNSIKTDSEK